MERGGGKRGFCFDFSKEVQEAEALHTTVINAYPDSKIAGQYMKLADSILKECQI